MYRPRVHFQNERERERRKEKREGRKEGTKEGRNKGRKYNKNINNIDINFGAKASQFDSFYSYIISPYLSI
jgi:flagellar biosynthesis/type III secretory pathway protein FliH